jgi:hypothetical protein
LRLAKSNQRYCLSPSSGVEEGIDPLVDVLALVDGSRRRRSRPPR